MQFDVFTWLSEKEFQSNHRMNYGAAESNKWFNRTPVRSAVEKQGWLRVGAGLPKR